MTWLTRLFSRISPAGQRKQNGVKHSDPVFEYYHHRIEEAAKALGVEPPKDKGETR